MLEIEAKMQESCRGSVTEHSQLKPEVSLVQLPVTAVQFIDIC